LSICEVNFRSALFRVVFNWMVVFNGKYQCHLCLCYLRHALTAESWRRLNNLKLDIVISAGDKLSAVNYILAKANQARSVVLMRPAHLALKKFDLVIIPQHDRPKVKKNVAITEGALNLIDAEYLKERSARLQQSGLLKGPLSNSCIGILIGGNSKKFAIAGRR